MMVVRRVALTLVAFSLLAIGTDFALRQVEFERLRTPIRARLSELLGRDVAISEPIHLGLLPSPQLEARGIRVLPAEASDLTPVEVERLSIKLDWLPLFRGILSVGAVEAHAAHLRIETAGGSADHAEPATQPRAARFQIRHVRLHDSRITILRSGSRAPFEIDFDVVDLVSNGRAEPIAVSGNGIFDGRVLTLAGEAGSLDALLDPGIAFPIAASIHLDEEPTPFARLSGSMLDPVGFVDAAFDVELRAETLGKLLPLEIPLSNEAVSATLRIRHLADRWSVEGEAEAGPDERERAEVRIAIADWSKPETLSSEFSLQFPSAEPWLAALGIPPGERGRGTLQAAGQLAGQPDGQVRIVVESEVADGGTLAGEALVSDLDGSIGIETGEIRLTTHDGIALKVRGHFDDLVNIDEMAFDIGVHAPDLATIGNWFDAGWPASGPVTLQGDLRVEDGRLVSQNATQLGQTRWTGRWEASSSESGRRSVSAELNSERVKLVDLGIGAEAQPEAEDTPGWLESWWSGNDALPIERLREVDLDLVLNAARVSGSGGFELRDVHTRVHLTDGRLAVRDVRADYDGGHVEAEFRVDARSEPVGWDLDVEAFNVDLTRTLAAFGDDDESAGSLDVSVDLTSRGVTRDQMTESLNGRAAATLQDGELVSRYARASTLDFLRIAVPDSMKLWSSEDTGRVHCLLAIARLDDGVATLERFFAESDRITLRGTGTVDLVNDELAVRLTPRVLDPGLLSIAAAVDVTGSLEDPDFAPVASSVASSAARAMLDNAMRPVRGALKHGLGRDSGAPEDLCAAAAVHLRGARMP
jgi:uncharacterized protein involved in outer membrane biogenesis